jgi:hypothetical protein
VLFLYSDDTTSPIQYLRNGNWTAVTINATKEIAQVNIYSSTNYSASQGYSLTAINYAQVESGSTATSYEPYSNICPISGSTSVTVTVSDGETSTTKTTALGQTVYGGQLNVLTGELTIDREFITFDGSENWQTNAGQNGYTLYNVLPTAITRGNGISNEFYVQTSYYTQMSLILGQNNRNIYAIQINNNISGVTDLASWKSWLSNNNCQICYDVAPQTVQLTPQEVNSLLGQNNISADTGDVDIVYVKASAPIQPNPTGTPTATLKKLGIEGTVFEVPSGGGGSSGGINYSTTEQVIGTWIDGKTIYCKCYQTTISNADNTYIDNTLNNSLIHVLPMSSISIDTEGSYDTSFVFNVYDGCILRIICNYVGVAINCENYNATKFGTSTVYVVLYYTKITD